jgi:hypothetical protein
MATLLMATVDASSTWLLSALHTFRWPLSPRTPLLTTVDTPSKWLLSIHLAFLLHTAL